jgi:hypothetical protein
MNVAHDVPVIETDFSSFYWWPEPMSIKQAYELLRIWDFLKNE